MRSILLLALILLLGAAPGGHAQTAAAPASTPSAAAPSAATPPAAQPIPAEDAQKVLAILKDPAKLAELTAVLEAMAKVQAPAPPPPAALPAALPLAPDSLGAELLVDVSGRLSSLSDDLMGALRTAANFPLIWNFVEWLVTDPGSQARLLGAAWQLVLAFAAGLLVQWLVRRLLARPMAALAAHAAARRTAESADASAEGEAAAEAGETEPRRPALTVLALLKRLPGTLGRLVLLLLPVLAFLATGYALLGAGLGADYTGRLVILAMMNAYAVCRAATCALRALAGPGEPRLFAVSDESAEYALRWVRRIAAVAVFGYTLAEIGLVFGMYRVVHAAVLKLVSLAVHVMLAVIVLQNRTRVAAWLRGDARRGDAKADGEGGGEGVASVLRSRLASVWHLLVIFYLMALWAVWAMNITDGFSRLLRLAAATVVVVVVARWALHQGLRLVGRWTTVPAEAAIRHPDLHARLTAYHPIGRAVVTAVVWAVAAVALLESWGVDALGWFTAGRLGGRLLSALGSIAATLLLGLIVWELANTGMQRYLARLAREGQLGRSARLRTLLPMIRTTLLVSIGLVAGLMILSEIGINIAPLLAGAGVVGLAIGFGSQKLVQDIITGLFLLLENAMSVGDAVTLGGLSGAVEALSVRTIRLRAVDGSIHIVPFSAVTTVTNLTRDFGFAVFDITVGVNEEPDRITALVREIANGMRQEPEWKSLILDDVEIWGLEKFVGNYWSLQGRIKSTASSRWAIRRELYRRIKLRFDELGIDSPWTSWEAKKQEPPTLIGFAEPSS